MLTIKQNKMARTTGIIFLLFAIFALVIAIGLFMQGRSVLDLRLAFSIIIFIETSILFGLSVFPKIILTDDKIIIRTTWPFHYLPIIYAKKFFDIDRAVITRTKYLSEFLSGNPSFENMCRIAKESLGESLRSKRNVFDRQIVIAGCIRRSVCNECLWICIIGKDEKIFMTKIDAFNEQEILKIKEMLLEKNVQAICKFEV